MAAITESIKENMASLENKFTELARKIKDDVALCLDNHLKGLKSDISTLISRINKLEDHVIQLESRIEVIERETRSCDLVVTGIPILPNENVASIINKISDVINYSKDNNVYRAFRIKSKLPKQQNAPPIIIKFQMKSAAIDFFSKYRAKHDLTLSDIDINDSKSRIYINGGLTAKNTHIYKEAKRRQKTGAIFKVYIKSGSIFVIKTSSSQPVLLHNVEDVFLSTENDKETCSATTTAVTPGLDKRQTRATTKSTSSTK